MSIVTKRDEIGTDRSAMICNSWTVSVRYDGSPVTCDLRYSSTKWMLFPRHSPHRKLCVCQKVAGCPCVAYTTMAEYAFPPIPHTRGVSWLLPEVMSRGNPVYGRTCTHTGLVSLPARCAWHCSTVVRRALG